LTDLQRSLQWKVCGYCGGLYDKTANFYPDPWLGFPGSEATWSEKYKPVYCVHCYKLVKPGFDEELKKFHDRTPEDL